MTQRIEAAGGDYRMEVLPELGGAIASLTWRHPKRGWTDLMRPVPAGTGTPQIGQTACFPLVPFANRLRDSRFTFRGRTVQFAAGPIGRHYLHGTAWLQPWRVAETGSGRLRLTQRNEAGPWPYPFDISQEFELGANGLTVRLRAGNRGSEPMPFGFGLHPYFPRTPLTRLDAAVRGWWDTDADVLPVTLTDVPPGVDPRRGLRVSDVICDNAFIGWQGPATITWPERGTRLTMTAPREFGVLFLYVPAGEDYFCVEPATNITDAFNLAEAGRADTGLIVLEPGAEVSADISFYAHVTD